MILSDPFSQNEFTDFINGFLPDFKLDIRKVETGSSGFSEVLRLGESSSLLTSVLIVRSKKNINSRISLTNNSFKILKAHQIYRALVVYVNEDDSIWRLSLLTAIPTFDSSGKIIVSYSNPRRHSYVLGSDVGIATARKYLSNMGTISDFEDLQLRFSIEVVNKDFYKEIAAHFYELVGRYGENKEVLQKPVLTLPGKIKKLEDLQNYSVRLLGRIIFLWFLKQKLSTTGKPLLPADLLTKKDGNYKNILHEKLEPIFFEVLNKQITHRELEFQEGSFSEVPYLNGGLFHPSEGEAGDFYSEKLKKSEIDIPDHWFSALFDTLNTYNFTIDENLENDVDLSIDPEMLGRIFENLLAEINPETGLIARKSTGSYYTPRIIVGYMVDEALYEYLRERTKVSSEKLKALLSLSRVDDLDHPLNHGERSKIVEAITQLRCLDPACGSGAFPMGLLQKLLWILSQVDPSGEDFLDAPDFEVTKHWLSESGLNYLRKRKLIRDVIFGSDIQFVAVEIAKLRFFLTLIVDQEIHDELQNRGVIPLPNLDFKFVCADSLTPLDENKQMSFGDDPGLEQKLDTIRKKYFTANNESRKTKLKTDYLNLVNASESLFEESARNTQLKSFNPFTENNQSKFFDPMIMYGCDKFDIVIGNPPYVSVKGISLPDKARFNEIYETGKGRFNLFTLFIERGLKLLTESGNLVYIIPDGLFSHTEYKHIRKYIVENGNVRQAVLFSKRVFEAAVDTAIIQISNSESDEPINVYRDLELLTGTFTQNDLDTPEDFIYPFMVESGNRDLISKIKLRGNYKLDDGFDLQQGIIYSGQTREEVFSNKKLTKQYKPSLDGRDISSYSINWDKKLENRYIKYSSALHRARDENLFLAPIKIVMPRKSTKLVASVDTENFYALNTAYVLVPRKDSLDPYFLTALLNSSLMSYYYKNLYFGWQVTIPALKALPICNIDKKLVAEITKLSKKAHDLSLQNVSIVELSHEIDSLVFKLYTLNKDEEEVILSEVFIVGESVVSN